LLSVNPLFWRGKRIFLTGHTGFKGSWLSLWLASMGAKVCGYSLSPPTNPNLFEIANVESLIYRSVIADINDSKQLHAEINDFQPEILMHMAAQSLVKFSYANPVETYMTNVMGTVNVLEGSRKVESIRSVLVVTSDKCYENKEWIWGYRENESMGGKDPYSNSKGCAELVCSAYRDSYFASPANLSLATARAGNVIGGGDWSLDRIVPDAIKAFMANRPLILRNPKAIRPWQHVLEPLSGYLTLVQALYQSGNQYSGGWNFGPQEADSRPVEEVVNLLIKEWGQAAKWEQDQGQHPSEAKFLKLDCSKAKEYLQWNARWNLEFAVKKTVDWYIALNNNCNMTEFSLQQIQEYSKS